VSVLRGGARVPGLLGLVPAITVTAFLARTLHRVVQHAQDPRREGREMRRVRCRGRDPAVRVRARAERVSIRS
jgi:hypothetical protein